MCTKMFQSQVMCDVRGCGLMSEFQIRVID